MKLVAFRIKNYKSIRDSGDCLIDGRITLLAGKNEAGKTAILEALEDFNFDKKIRDEAIPIENENAKSQIELALKFEPEDMKQIATKFNLSKIDDKNYIVHIIKTYPDVYNILPDAEAHPFMAEKGPLVVQFTKLFNELDGYVSNLPVNKEFPETKEQCANIQNYSPQLKVGAGVNAQIKLNEIINSFKECISKLNALKQAQNEFLQFLNKHLLPNFILFKSFEDILPSQTPISQVQNNQILKDLGAISNLDINLIQPSTDPRKKVKHKEEINLKFASDYRQFWSQDDAKLFIEVDQSNLHLFVREGNQFYTPSMRSKGRQWHLSFYIRVTARSLEGRRNIILIDEPGMFLHARAQKEILKRLEDCSDRNQVVFTTHSPYLIERDKLQRVRLVLKDAEGTTTTKITAKADKETLTPILTAIGEDLSSGIRVDKKNSLVVEGYSDYLWLTAFKKLLKINADLNIVPAVGADSSVHVGSILFGWGLDPIFLLDNDAKGKQVAKRLQEELAIDAKRIIHVPENQEGAIEQLFSQEDYQKHITNNATSERKTVLATEFYNKVENKEIDISDFSQVTKKNFEQLFTRLQTIADQ